MLTQTKKNNMGIILFLSLIIYVGLLVVDLFVKKKSGKNPYHYPKCATQIAVCLILADMDYFHPTNADWGNFQNYVVNFPLTCWSNQIYVFLLISMILLYSFFCIRNIYENFKK